MAKTNTGWKGRQMIYNKAYPMTGIGSFEKVMENLNIKLAEIKGGTLQGLLLSAALIRRETETQPPVTPIDTGNLRASWFTVSTKGRAFQVKRRVGGVIREVRERGATTFKGSNSGRMSREHFAMIEQAQGMVKENDLEIKVIMGYTANYAMYVHENIYAKFKRPMSGAKWFETAVKRNAWKILSIIKGNAKLQ